MRRLVGYLAIVALIGLAVTGFACALVLLWAWASGIL